MKKHNPDVTAVLMQVLQIALRIVESGGQPVAAKKTAGLPKGIYPHQSKYNPFRAYVWDKSLRATIYLGAFPSITKARHAQKAYHAGQPVTSGTKAVSARVTALH